MTEEEKPNFLKDLEKMKSGDVSEIIHVFGYSEKYEELVEKVADFMHDQWSHRMKYQVEKIFNYQSWSNEKYELIERWKRQMVTDYKDLSEEEKDSDREWARKLLEVIK